jgi:antirestriction protein ArdC
MSATATREDVYTRVTSKIVADLEKGVRPWLKPWNAEHAAGRITRPLRGNGQPYKGINVLSLWMDAELRRSCFNRYRHRTLSVPPQNE